MNTKDEKKVNITIDPNVINADTYNEQIVKFDKENFHINFSHRSDTDDAINIEIKEIVSIPADKMRTFCYHVIDSLLEYEKTYKNGLGLELPKKEKSK